MGSRKIACDDNQILREIRMRQMSESATRSNMPFTLKHGENEYKLKFNCKPCEMEIWEKDAELTFEEDL